MIKLKSSFFGEPQIDITPGFHKRKAKDRIKLLDAWIGNLRDLRNAAAAEKDNTLKVEDIRNAADMRRRA